MPKVKISEFDIDPANNTDINNINIAEGCAPSGINNAIRQLMSDLKEFQTGAGGDPFNGAVNGTVGATTPAAGAFTTLSASSTVSGTGFSTYLASPPAIGGTAAAAGNFTTLGASSTATLNTLSSSGATITGGSINGTTVGASTASTGAFTTLGATGVATFSAGTVSAPAITTSGDTNTGIFFPAADTIAFTEGGTESMRITSAGNVGIGNSSPTNATNAPTLNVGTNRGTLYVGVNNIYDDGSLMNINGVRPIAFLTSSTERMRIDNSGNVLIGSTTNFASSKLFVNNSITTNYDGAIGLRYNVSGQTNSYYKGMTGLSITNSNARGLHIFNYDADGSQGIRFYPNNYAGQNANPAVTFTSTGNVGIGTSSPATKLEVIGTSFGSYGQILLGDSETDASTKRFGVLGNHYTNAEEPFSLIAGASTLTENILHVGGNSSTNTVNSSTSIRFYTADNNTTQSGTERMRLDSSGNVGIGTTSPAEKLDINGNLKMPAASYIDIGSSAGLNTLTLGKTSTSTGDIARQFVILSRFSSGDRTLTLTAGNGIADSTIAASSALLFASGGTTERMRIDSSGNLIVGTTSRINLGKFSLLIDASTSRGYTTQPTTNTSYIAADFRSSSNAGIGSISCSTTATSYATSSDYRLKENIAPMTGALAAVSQLKPCTYTWKTDGSSGQGFIAHELQEVVPDCVTGEKDAVEEDGSIKAQGIDTSFLVATLTAAIQEQQAIINDLKARIETLESK
jgi:hypothetical protein